MRLVDAVLGRARVHAPRLMAMAERELPLRSVADLYTPAPPTGHSIPNILYQTWIDTRLGRTHAATLADMRRANADYGFDFFDEAAISAYMDDAYAGTQIARIFKAARFGPLRTDIWRYCILLERGGVYCDIGKGFRAPLREIVPADATAVITYERNAFEADAAPPAGLQYSGRRVVNWALAFAPGHPLLRRVIDGIVEKYPRYAGKTCADPKLDILYFTGPIHLTECVHAHARANGMSDVHQAGVDFGGRGEPGLPGSYVRYVSLPSYANARDRTIVD